MIVGVGIDLCDVARVERACASPAFCRRVFTDGELEYAASRAGRSETLAGCFAAKEAFAKATGLGLARAGLKSVEVVHGRNGRPALRLRPGEGFPPELAPGKARFHLSISHDGGRAAAVVVYEVPGD